MARRKTKKPDTAPEDDAQIPDEAVGMLNKVLSLGDRAKLKRLTDLYRRMGEGEKLKPSEVKEVTTLEKYFEGKLNGEVKDGEVINSFEDAAKYLGVSKRTIHVQLKKGTFNQNPDGTFFRAELDKYKDKGADKVRLLDTELRKEQAELRYRRARARREEMLVDQMRGSLIAKKDVQAEWAGRVLELKSGLMQFATRLSPMLVGKSRDEISDIIESEIWNLLDQYSRTGTYCPEVDPP